MFGLKKLFGNTPTPAAKASEPVPTPPPANDFLLRTAIFDRKHRPAGHLFHLRQASADAGAPTARQRQFDDALLNMLLTTPEAWKDSQAFVPISSASLGHAAVDRLIKPNLVLNIQLAEEDSDPEALVERLKQLRQGGLSIGIFRQPRHPAFAQAIAQADFAIIDVAPNEAGAIRDFSAAIRAGESAHPVRLFGINIDTPDEHHLCHQWHFELFQGRFATSDSPRPERPHADPHKVLLLNLLRLVQGDAENPEIVEALKQDPLLTFRILRYLNSPGLGLSHKIESINQALVILGRQRLTRWLAVLLFSAREPDFGDWLLVESALTRGRLMEVLGKELLPNQSQDSLFMTGIFSCLDRLLRRPLHEALNTMPLPEVVRQALLDRSGPLAPLLDVAEASDAFDLTRIEAAAATAGLPADTVNRALLAATAWASEMTEHWE